MGTQPPMVPPGRNGTWPAVAITKEGYAILTYSNAFTKSNPVLRYPCGTLDLGGGTDQLIDFKEQHVKLDTGFHDSISVNYNGTIAEAHEAPSYLFPPRFPPPPAPLSPSSAFFRRTIPICNPSALQTGKPAKTPPNLPLMALKAHSLPHQSKAEGR